MSESHGLHRVVDMQFFDDPRFETLYAAWEKVFELAADGTYVLDPKAAIKCVNEAREAAQLEDPMGFAAVEDLDNIACRYAQEIPIQVAEEFKI